MSLPDKLLTIYPQRKWHHNAYVVGNRAGLLELRAAIDIALAGNPHNISVGLATVAPTDHETYFVAVVCDGEENDDVDTAYWDDEAEGFRLGASGNSMVPSERYIMAVGVQSNKKWLEFTEANRREIEASHREQRKAAKKARKKARKAQK